MKDSSVTLEGRISFEWWQKGTKLKWVQKLWKINVESRYVNGNVIYRRIQTMCDKMAKQGQRLHLVGLILIMSCSPKYKERIKFESPSFEKLGHIITFMTEIY